MPSLVQNFLDNESTNKSHPDKETHKRFLPALFVVSLCLGISPSLNKAPYITLIDTVLMDATGVNCAMSLRHEETRAQQGSHSKVHHGGSFVGCDGQGSECEHTPIRNLNEIYCNRS